MFFMAFFYLIKQHQDLLNKMSLPATHRKIWVCPQASNRAAQAVAEVFGPLHTLSEALLSASLNSNQIATSNLTNVTKNHSQ